jgi:hypothetical protein
MEPLTPPSKNSVDDGGCRNSSAGTKNTGSCGCHDNELFETNWHQTGKGRIAISMALLICVSWAVEHFTPGAGKWPFVGASLIGLAPVARTAFAALREGRPFTIESLMTIAGTGALFIGAAEEAAVVVFLFAVGELLEGVAAGKARQGIRALADLVPTLKLEDSFLALKVSDREAKKWAALVCGSVCLAFSESEWGLTEKVANELASGFDFSRFTRTEKDSHAALMRLLTHRLPASLGAIPLTVAEVIAKVRDQSATPKAAESEEKTLGSLGLAFRDGSLIIQYEHSALSDLFRAEPYNGKAQRIRDELKQVEGATIKKQLRVSGVRMSAIIIPEAALSSYLAEPANPF